MSNLQNRHDLKDREWKKIKPIISKLVGNWGGSIVKQLQTSNTRIFK